MQILSRHAGCDAELDEEVKGVADLVDESFPVYWFSRLLPGLELELLHSLGELSNRVTEKLVDPSDHQPVIQVALLIRLDYHAEVLQFSQVVLCHQVSLTLEDHLQGIHYRLLSVVRDEPGALPDRVLGGLTRDERLLNGAMGN